MIAPTVDLRIAAWILAIEGGLADVVGDRGGVTYAGITAPAAAELKNSDGTYVFDFDHDGDVDSADIRALAEMPSAQRDALIGQFYERRWNNSGAARLPWPASLLVFDGDIHSGPRAGVRLVQEAVNRTGVGRVVEDGIIGKATVAALHLANTKMLVDSYYRRRMNFLIELCRKRPSQLKFWWGWANRVERLTALAERP